MAASPGPVRRFRPASAYRRKVDRSSSACLLGPAILHRNANPQSLSVSSWTACGRSGRELLLRIDLQFGADGQANPC
jgi:hypothetical protein